MKKQIYIVALLAIILGFGASWYHRYNTPEAQFARIKKQYSENPSFASIETPLKRNLTNFYNNPKDAEAAIGVGSNFYVLSDYKDALYYYQKAEKLVPDNFLPHYNSGEAYYQLKQYDDSKKELLESNRLNPSHYGTYFELENLYVIHFKDHLSVMEDLYKKAIEQFPDDKNFKSALNQFYDRTGQKDKMTK